MSNPKSIDLDEFEAAGSKKPKCWFVRLTGDQREKVLAAHGADYTQPTIAQVVTGWGIPVGRRAVGDHFRGTCSCD